MLTIAPFPSFFIFNTLAGLESHGMWFHCAQHPFCRSVINCQAAFHPCNKIPKIINLERQRTHFWLTGWRFQSNIRLSSGFEPLVGIPGSNDEEHGAEQAGGTEMRKDAIMIAVKSNDLRTSLWDHTSQRFTPSPKYHSVHQAFNTPKFYWIFIQTTAETDLQVLQLVPEHLWEGCNSACTWENKKTSSEYDGLFL